MSIKNFLNERSNSKCELCSAVDGLQVFNLNPARTNAGDSAVYLCEVCACGVADPANNDVNHWRCLSESMWSEHPAVQVLAYRILKHLSAGGLAWADDLMGQLYLDDDLLNWALSAPLVAADIDHEVLPTLDSNGTALSAGDTVTLIKDLEVKGANFTAKRGTTVKNISLTDDPRYVEGKVNSTVIVLVSAYLKKA